MEGKEESMRIVIFSDVHGNIVALEAVLAEIRRTAAPDALFVAGDLAMSGPRPVEALAQLRALEDARFVMGNTDKDLVDAPPGDMDIDWTRAHLSADDMAFLRGLPFAQRLEVAPGHELLVVHANPRDLENPIRPDSSDVLIRPWFEGVTAEVVAFGHYHVPFVLQLDQWTLVDVGSVGLPRDGDQRAVYVILTWERGAWQIEHRRVRFDIEAVARDYATVGYPDAQQAAQRLLKARYTWGFSTGSQA
jgi:predicted phosphodiesterase